VTGSVDHSLARETAGAELDGVEPGRARAAVRGLFARPVLAIRDLTAPLLVMPDDRHAGDLPGVAPLDQLTTTVGGDPRNVVIAVAGSAFPCARA
jgi:hypothetical protein